MLAAFVQLVILGLLAGGVYVAVGVGFGLVWGVLNIVNLAHGALVIVGGYITWQLFTAFGLDPFLTLPVDAVALFVLGYALQRGVINRIIRAPLLFTFLLTFGLNLVIVNILLLIFGSDFRSVTPTYSGQGFEIGGIVVPYVRLTSLGAAILLSAGLAFLLSRTRIGLAIHAIAFGLMVLVLVTRPQGLMGRLR
ncbi:MAG: branched-chain amino acid ABC transporter permease [Chloroflexi bacterium]|nr:MAG: branched-chain amino acid ABC transporter permease [Chloroflexota bacterium]